MTAGYRPLTIPVFAFLLTFLFSCKPERVLHGDIDGEYEGSPGGGKVYYNENVGIPPYNKMIATEGPFVFTMYDMTDLVPITETRNARIEKLCTSGASTRPSPECYVTDGTAYFREDYPQNRQLLGSEEASIRTLFDSGNRRYNLERGWIRAEIEAGQKNKLNALRP